MDEPCFKSIKIERWYYNENGFEQYIEMDDRLYDNLVNNYHYDNLVNDLMYLAWQEKQYMRVITESPFDDNLSTKMTTCYNNYYSSIVRKDDAVKEVFESLSDDIRDSMESIYNKILCFLEQTNNSFSQSVYEDHIETTLFHNLTIEGKPIYKVYCYEFYMEEEMRCSSGIHGGSK